MKNKIKICHLTSVHPTFDNRIFHKQCKALAKAGYEVALIAQHDKNEIKDDIRIIALPKINNRVYRIFGVTFMALIKALRQKAEVYHFHDPELIPIGLVLKLFSKKVIYDVHELVFYDIQEKHWLKSSLLRRGVQLVYSFLERLSVRYFDAVILAEDGYLPYFTEKYPGHINKFTKIRNFPVLELIDKISPLGTKKDKKIIVYAGALDQSRSIREMIQMMTIIKDEAELWLLGGWESDQLRKECEELDGWKYVKYFGFKKVEEVYAYIKAADVALVLYKPVMNNITTLPVKVFEYMACSIPFVQSNFLNWEKLFKGASLSASPDDPKDIAKQVRMLLSDECLRNNMGRNGREILNHEQYVWEKESNTLLDLYEHCHASRFVATTREDTGDRNT